MFVPGVVTSTITFSPAKTELTVEFNKLEESKTSLSIRKVTELTVVFNKLEESNWSTLISICVVPEFKLYPDISP